jgi:hypothetical protein
MKLLIRILVTSGLVLLIANFMTELQPVYNSTNCSSCFRVAQYFYQTYFSYTDITSNFYYSWAFLLVINAIIILL